MELRHLVFLAGLALAGAALEGCTDASARQVEGSPKSEVALVVFANDFAMVNDVRNIPLKSGLNDVSLNGVSDMIDPSSAVYYWPKGDGQRVVASTFERGLRDSQNLLTANIGQEVSLVYRGQDGQVADREQGILESASPGGIIVRVGDKHVVNPDATIEVPDSTGTAMVPGLKAQIDSKSDGVGALGVSYLTRGLSWSADYVAVLPADEERMDLQAWATITNRTSTTFHASSIRFVAGSPNRAAVSGTAELRGKDEAPSLGLLKEKMYTGATIEQAESVGELHAYPYEAKATVLPNQDSRIEMLQAKVGVSRDYAVRLPSLGYYEIYGRPEQRIAATLSVAFKNSEDQGLGLPLPAGRVRFYEPGKDGALVYIGAAAIDDTPKDAKQTLTISDVFDVYAEQTVSQATRIDKRTVSREVTVKIHNEKNHDADVRVVQDFYQDWKITDESAPSKKISARLAQWTVKVPAGKEMTLSYRVLLK